MQKDYISVEQSLGLKGSVKLAGAKNAVLVIIASLILTDGKSKLTNVPNSEDIGFMCQLIEELGGIIKFDIKNKILEIDTTGITKYTVSPHLMHAMRASVLVMGPLLAKFGRTEVTLPGGCVIGKRPINYHLKNFRKMGVKIFQDRAHLCASVDKLQPARIVLDYPSVGATENILMAATLTTGITKIINAAIEPEVIDLIDVLKKMGAKIEINAPATIVIEGVETLKPIEHEILHDRLEAGSLLLAAAVTQGEIYLPDADPNNLDVFLMKLEEMGHILKYEEGKKGIGLIGTDNPIAVSFKTSPYPGFPTDLQAPMMVAQCLSRGTCIIEETVFENRMLHVHELQKLGAVINVTGTKAEITGVEELYGTEVIGTDIRSSMALVLAGLAAKGNTEISGLKHFRRGFDAMECKLQQLGAKITVFDPQIILESEQENAI